jgi:hypothetical protein
MPRFIAAKLKEETGRFLFLSILLNIQATTIYFT